MLYFLGSDDDFLVDFVLAAVVPRSVVFWDKADGSIETVAAPAVAPPGGAGLPHPGGGFRTPPPPPPPPPAGADAALVLLLGFAVGGGIMDGSVAAVTGLLAENLAAMLDAEVVLVLIGGAAVAVALGTAAGLVVARVALGGGAYCCAVSS